MARQFGKAGLSARQTARGRYLKVSLYAALLLAAAIILHFKSSKFAEFSGLAGTLMALCIAGVLRLLMGYLHTETAKTANQAKDANQDARAEERVARQLDDLPAGFFVFHDIDCAGLNIDHLVVGFAGVFVIAVNSTSATVNVKEDMLRLNGEITPTNSLSEVLNQTASLQKYLWKMTSQEWPITPLICFTSTCVTVRRPVSGVHLIGVNDLCTFLRQQPARLATAAIEHVLQVFKLCLKKQHAPSSKS